MRVNSFFHTIAVLAVAVSALLMVGCGIDSPTTSFQGYLTNPSGAPVADGTYNAEYALFNSPTGTGLVYTETGTITVTNGLFSTSFGGANPDVATDALAQELWLQVTIEGETLSPRQRLQGAPFAWTLVSGSVIAGQEEITRTLLGFDNVGAGVIVGNFVSGDSGGSGIVGVTFSENNDAAGVIAASQSGSYGARATSQEYRGLRGETFSNTWYSAFFTGGIGIGVVGGGCNGCRITEYAVNVGDEAIAPGDMVAVAGIVADANGNPTMQVNRASSADAVIVGVARGASAGPNATAKSELGDLSLVPAQSGDYVVVGVMGLFEVKVADGTDVAVGDYLTAGADGATVLANRADSNNTSARVMSAPDANGMVWVMLGGQ